MPSPRLNFLLSHDADDLFLAIYNGITANDKDRAGQHRRAALRNDARLYRVMRQATTTRAVTAFATPDLDLFLKRFMVIYGPLALTIRTIVNKNGISRLLDARETAVAFVSDIESVHSSIFGTRRTNDDHQLPRRLHWTCQHQHRRHGRQCQPLLCCQLCGIHGPAVTRRARQFHQQRPIPLRRHCEGKASYLRRDLRDLAAGSAHHRPHSRHEAAVQA